MRRRTLLGAATVLLPFGARVVSAAPPPEAVTPALIEAAKKEGKVSYYTAMDLSVAEPMAKAFEAKYPGIKVAVERTGAERLFNRIAQETASNIHRCDVVNSSDAAHFITWKRQGWLEPYVTVDMAENVPAEQARSRRHLRQPAHASERHRLQHQPGEARGRAQGLQRPARSQVRRQAGQGPSRLFRHHHDGHPADRARAGLGLLREARQAEGAAGPVGHRAAQEDRGRRARHRRRRQRLSVLDGQGARRADRGRACRSRARRRSPTRWRCSRRRPIPTRRGCWSPGSCRPRARNSSST